MVGRGTYSRILVFITLFLLTGCGKSESQRIADEHEAANPALVEFEREVVSSGRRLRAIRDDVDSQFNIAKLSSNSTNAILIVKIQAKLRIAKAHSDENTKVMDAFTACSNKLLGMRVQKTISMETLNWASLERDKHLAQHEKDCALTNRYPDQL